MALFKVFRGQRNDLDGVTKVDGHAYFCTDDGSFWIDYLDGTEIKRKQVNESELASLNNKFDDYVLLNDKNVNGNIALADKKLDPDYELTLTPNFIRLLDSSTGSPSAFFLEADGGIVDLALSTQNADDHNEYYTRLNYNEIVNGITDEDGDNVAYASLSGRWGCLEVYSSEYGYAYFAPDGVSTDDGWMNLPQSSNNYNFDFSNNLRTAGFISVFETADFENEKWSTTYGWETITWRGVDGNGTPIANHFSLPSEVNAGGTFATREWVQTKIPTIDTDAFAKLNSYNTFTKGNKFIADYSFNEDGTRNSFDIRVDYYGEGFFMQANPGGWYISDLSQTQSFNMDNKGNFQISDSVNGRYTTYSLPVLSRTEDVIVTASQIEWLIVN